MRRRAVHAVLVLTKIVPFAPMRIRKHRVGLYNHLELFLVAALDTKKKKNRGYIRNLHRDSEEGVGAQPCPDDV